MRPFPHIVPFYYTANGADIDWPAEVSEELSGIRRQISALREEERTFLQRKARELGISAEELSDLRSVKGNPFVETERRGGWRELATAVEEGVDHYDSERAYLCTTRSALFGLDREEHGCGWVRGIPRTEEYDDLAGHMLAGSAGHRHYCRICGVMLAEDRQIVS